MALEQMELADILSGVDRPVIPPKAEAVPEAPPAEAPAAPPEKQEKYTSRKQAHRDKEQLAQGRVRDVETGQFSTKEEPPLVAVPKEEPPVEEPAPIAAPVKVPVPAQPEMSDKEKALLAAARSERSKRQELERRLEALEGKKPPESEPKTFWDDPQGTLEKFEQNIQSITLKTRLDTAESIARNKYPDFEEKVAIFSKLLQDTPGLRERWIADADPAEFAYRSGKHFMQIEQAGSVEALTAKIEKETRLKVEQEFKQKQVEEAKTRAAIPGSLSEVSGSNPSKPVWGGPTPMDSILKP